MTGIKLLNLSPCPCLYFQDDAKKVTACRYDWHQTATFVIMSVFAKVAQPSESWVDVNRVSAKVHIAFDVGNSMFDEHIILNGVSGFINTIGHIILNGFTIKKIGTKHPHTHISSGNYATNLEHPPPPPPPTT